MSATDLWYRYGRDRAEHDRAVPDEFRWTWSQEEGPGAEVLEPLSESVLGDLGAGAARHAAHLAAHHAPLRVDAVDASAAQHGLAAGLYASLAPALRLVHAEVVTHLRAAPRAYDTLYSVFGALCFTDPHELLPAACAALRPGGRIVFSTLAHHLNGSPARADVAPTAISVRTPDGEAATLHRWVLQEHVWAKALDEAGFTRVSTELLPTRAEGPRSADTYLVSACRPAE